MQIKILVLISFASVVFAQFIPENVHDMPEMTITSPVTIATAPPAPDDTLARSLASEASVRVSSVNSAGQSALASITSQIGAEASQISSKLNSVSSSIASRSRDSDAGSATGNQAAPAPTGAMAMGALFGIGALVANY